MAPPAPSPRTARSRLASRPARRLAAAALAAAALVAVLAASAPTLARAQPAAKAAAAAPGATSPSHAPLTPVEQRYTNMLLRLLMDESPADAASVVVGMLRTYAAPTGPTAPDCAVSPTAARRFRQLPVPSAPKWEGLFKAMAACRRAPAGKAGPCTQSALDGFGIGTHGAQRDLVNVFMCELLCTETQEGCDDGKPCASVLSYSECSRKRAPGGVSAPKGASYYYLESGKK